MRKKDELSTETSCLNRAADDEPVFVLRANDVAAPVVVEVWAAKYRARKISEGKFDRQAMDKHDEAMYLAELMREWKEASDNAEQKS